MPAPAGDYGLPVSFLILPMRILETIPHPDFHISILYMNEKYLLKIEAGPYEQVYKFTREMASDVEGVKKIVTPVFLAGCKKAFDQMHEEFVRNYQ